MSEFSSDAELFLALERRLGLQRFGESFRDPRTGDVYTLDHWGARTPAKRAMIYHEIRDMVVNSRTRRD